MVEFNYQICSIDGYGGWRDGEIFIFVNEIYKDCKGDMRLFIAQVCSTELHELGHIYEPYKGCNNRNDCTADKCAWCRFSKRMDDWFYKNMRV